MQGNAVRFDGDHEERSAVGFDQRSDDVLANLENLLARDGNGPESSTTARPELIQNARLDLWSRVA